MKSYNNIFKRDLLVINSLLTEGNCNKENLQRILKLASFNASDRTFYRTLKDIKTNYGIEIVADRGTQSYRIKSSLEHARMVLELLSLSDNFESAIDSFKGDKKRLKYLLISEDPIYYNKVVIRRIFDAIMRKVCLKITYNVCGQKKVYKYYFEPYYIKVSSGRWYLIARNEEYGFKALELNKIEKVSYTTISYNRKNINFTLEEKCILREAYDEIVNVKIKTSESLANELKFNPIHQSQIEVSENHFTFSMDDHYGIVHRFLAYGTELEVLEPESLRLRMKESLEVMLSKYS